MGTIVRLTLAVPDQSQADAAAESAMHRIRELQRDLDHRNPAGSIGRINRSAGKGFVRPTAFALALIERALAFAAETGGSFDPTIGAVTTTPFYFALDPSIAASKAGLVDYRKVRIRDGMVRLEETGMALDLGGLAKGTIIDEAVRTLRAMGVAAGMVEAGGDFRCFGDRDWAIGVQNPRHTDADDEAEGQNAPGEEAKDQVLETLHVRERAVCGSGDYRRFVLLEHGNVQARRHHILNPATLASADASIAVTVMAPTAERADELATALFVLGPDQGLAFLRAHAPDAVAQWVQPDMTTVSSPGFPAD